MKVKKKVEERKENVEKCDERKIKNEMHKSVGCLEYIGYVIM